MSQHYGIKRVNTALALVHGVAATTQTSSAVVLNGLLHEVLITAPAAVDAAATLTVNLIDQDGYTVYTKGALAAASVTLDLLSGITVPLSGSYTLQVVFSAAQTVTDTITNTVLLIEAVL